MLRPPRPLDPLKAAQARLERAARLETRAVYRQADAAYAGFSCPASAECCQLAKTGRQPWLWLGEWLVLKERLEREGRQVTAREDGACPLLGEGGRCTVYEDRPFGCRTFFCARVRGPDRQPVEEVDALLRRLERLSRAVDPDTEPRTLLDWLLSLR
jgi:Fe-S-cluster containining protein